jgi:L-amino acid N-acyltransferase YncA
MLRRMRDIIDRGFPYLVAEIDGQVAGYAYANTYRTRVAYQWTVENSVYVDAAFQGKGVGTGLLQALIDACVARGYRQMVAVIGEPTNTASISCTNASASSWSACSVASAASMAAGWIPCRCSARSAMAPTRTFQ